jgi:hypothetical protein
MAKRRPGWRSATCCAPTRAAITARQPPPTWDPVTSVNGFKVSRFFAGFFAFQGCKFGDVVFNHPFCGRTNSSVSGTKAAAPP